MEQPSLSTDEQPRADSPDNSDRPRIKTQLYKTEACQNWLLYGVCGYGVLCKFAHGPCEQRARPRHPKYRTSMCKDFPLGMCAFGNRCNFAHTLDELRTPIPTVPVGVPADSATNRPPAGTYKKPSAATDSRLPAITRVASNLRRNQSMGTLRSPHAAANSALLAAALHPVPPLPAHVPGVHPATGDAATLTMHQTFAHLPSEQLGTASSQHYPGMPKQPLHHLQHEHAARRVSSLSQLPSLRTSSSYSSPATTTAPPNGYYERNFLSAAPAVLSTGLPLPHPTQSLAYYASPLAQMAPVGAASPALSSLSFWGSDDASTLQPLADGDALVAEYLRVQQQQQQLQQHPTPAVPVLSNDAITMQHQRRTLTSSVSMHALPRLQAPAGWEQRQYSPQPGTLSLSSSIPILRSIASSQSSAATLIDSEGWPSNAQLKSFNLELQLAKPPGSRFFPSSSTETVTTMTVATTGAGIQTGVDPFSTYHNGAYYPHNHQQQQLRRQHSTDDWISLRSATREQMAVPHRQLTPSSNPGLLLESSGLY
ncbi:hypothetical protein GGI20_001427, partial [Coemansia sp. BCRC 34301]